ncbi:hypothetical protein BKP37_05175 [Anaerobacillus alkalilacustris]|uniref:serine-type D-Ala-D-Ala carboxypeptidase n=1 Tax=Anaerobacillus alkalilacustris TaxID=393763 RepID=A0A1S2LY62_9BACI|nr:penicillin-binding protein 2 [Anaerobacillus alkalilacustris]OIJ16627.1 hypothetical protein BKP37_05175 [Anaerobacillus alkalilacustris]
MTIHKRIIQILVISAVIMFIIILRLAYVQLYATNHFSKNNIDLVEESIKQRTQTFVLHSGRGYFTDRNGKALNSDYYPCLILFPFLQTRDWPVEKISNILQIEKEQILEALNASKEPFILKVDGNPLKLSGNDMEKINQLRIPGVFVHNVQQRTENIAPHLLGVLGENVEEVKRRYETQVANGSISVHSEIGVSGMQRAFDPFLISQGNSSLAYFVDNLNQPLFGFDVKYNAPANPYHPTEVITTIDKDIQKYVINVLREVGLTKGGAVILDVESNDLLSLVSLPTYNVNFPFDEGAVNHIVTSYTPGSIFKIVVAAAAIDLNLINKNDLFDCNKDLYGDGDEPRQLGKLTFHESFAQSCNFTFAYLAYELLKKDDKVLQKYAKKLGLLDKVGWNGDIFRLESIAHFPEEEKGIISEGEIDLKDKYAIAQTAIGQKNVRITPLAVANMLATIARGGEKKQVRGASKIKYENGTTFVDFPIHTINDHENISRYTAMRLQELLRSVVKMELGTAHHVLQKNPYPIAGKTGTAQKGIEKKDLTHWFAGYFPTDNPKYVMVIIDLDHRNGDMKTLKAFNKIVEYLHKVDSL